MAVTGIDQFMSKIGKQRGMSLTTGFDVIFELPDTLKESHPYYQEGDSKDIVTMLCDEAQLPNVQSATGQLSGRFLGEAAVQYPHSRLYTDVGLGFLCDAKLIPLKFFNYWYDWMFNETRTIASNSGISGALSAFPKLDNRHNRLKYQNDYAAKVKIIKTEPNAKSSNGRAPITYILENAYPYAIDAVPLSYGVSQITRVNVNFHYSRHTVVYGEGPTDPQANLGLNFLDDSGDLNFITDNLA